VRAGTTRDQAFAASVSTEVGTLAVGRRCYRSAPPSTGSSRYAAAGTPTVIHRTHRHTYTPSRAEILSPDLGS